jgi:hypothetical protein
MFLIVLMTGFLAPKISESIGEISNIVLLQKPSSLADLYSMIGVLKPPA